MASGGIRSSTPANVLLALVCLVLAGFLLFIGIGHLAHPDVPREYSTQNTAISLGFCALGLAALLVAFSILRRMRSRRPLNAA